MATGWLGWSDADAMSVPLCRIEHALKGKIDFVVKTNPFGGKKDEEGTTDFDPKELTVERRAKVASEIRSAMSALGSKK